MLYNKYRPSSFDEVIGQPHIVATIKKAIENRKLPHAILLSGTAGTGKTTMARIIAGELKVFDTDLHEIDAASHNSVEDARRLVKMSRVPPSGKYKVFIIDEAHVYSQMAFNALLKVIEEPPKHAYFILCTTEKHKIIPTIRSRCMSLDLRNISEQDIVNQLIFVCTEEKIAYQPEALYMIANCSDGSMRNALSNLQLCIHNCTEETVEQNLGIIGYRSMVPLFEALRDASMDQVFIEIRKLQRKFAIHQLIEEIGIFTRDLFMYKSQDTANLMTSSDTKTKVMTKLLKELTIPFTFAMLDITKMISTLINTTVSNNAMKLLVEIELVKLAKKRKVWLKNKK